MNGTRSKNMLNKITLGSQYKKFDAQIEGLPKKDLFPPKPQKKGTNRLFCVQGKSFFLAKAKRLRFRGFQFFYIMSFNMCACKQTIIIIIVIIIVIIVIVIYILNVI